MADEKKPGPPNMDLIQMVQRARMMHDADAKPSAVSAVYWIEAKYEGDNVKPPTAQAGSWLIDVPTDTADGAWAQIKAATLAGKLGYKSKVSTATRSGAATASRTIIVRAADPGDKNRIQVALRELNIPGEWRYEPD